MGITLQRWVGAIATGGLLALSTFSSAIADPLPSAAPKQQTPLPIPGLVQYHLYHLLANTAPTLPPLGNADPFLPSPDPIAETALVIDLSDRRVYVYHWDQLHTSFPVAIGRGGWETPVGEFEVIQMIRDPSWRNPFTGEVAPPGGSNPLGVRWIGFWTDGTNYIGFHGTPNEDSVGRAASHGCVRMYNRDVVQLFEMVQMGTPVSVVP